MFYPVAILVYVLEVACVAMLMKNQTARTRTVTAFVIVIATAALFWWLVQND